MTDHADLTARLRGWADAWDDLHGDRLATASTIRADGQTHALRSADVRLLLDALDAADAENARLTAERDEALAEVAQLRRLIQQHRDYEVTDDDLWAVLAVPRRRPKVSNDSPEPRWADLLAAVICWPFEVGTRFACRMRGHKLDSWSTIEFCRRPFCRYRAHVEKRHLPVPPCSTCGGSGKRYPHLATFDDPCPDCREETP